ncbi:hypothetical protein [Streptomyces sp. NBC_00467]|uniref:hypothetical protein n=1 Tax=Streptomyces sp. NBC_00467 TaxID=2975752 RepID=UPI002E1958C4
MHFRSSLRFDRLIALALAAVAITLFAWGTGSLRLPASTAASDGRLGELAGAAGCRTPRVEDEAGYRLAACEDGSARYVLATFSSAGDQARWLVETLPPGSTYVTGDGWIAYGMPAMVRSLQRNLGGHVLTMERKP